MSQRSDVFQIKKITGWAMGIGIGLVISLLTSIFLSWLDFDLMVYWLIILVLVTIAVSDFYLIEFLEINKIGLIIGLPILAFIVIFTQAFFGGLFIGELWKVTKVTALATLIIGVIATVSGLMYIKFFEGTKNSITRTLILLGYVAMLVSVPAIFPIASSV